MKFIKFKFNYLLTGFLLAVAIGFYACNSEDEMVPKTLEQYRVELNEIVSSEKETVRNCVMGYDKGNFRIDTILFLEATTEYLNALNDAEIILTTEGITIADVMDANYLISKPGKVFNDNVWISDRRQLNEAIVYSDTLRVRTPEGNEPGMAPKEARDRFGNAIIKAKQVRGSSSSIVRQVIAATEELNLELEIFVEAIIK